MPMMRSRGATPAERVLGVLRISARILSSGPRLSTCCEIPTRTVRAPASCSLR